MLARYPSGVRIMYPFTLQTEIMRHMLNIAKHMASGDLL
jgi:hypothetical protein